MDYEVIGVALVFYLWILAAWNSLNRVSRGRIRVIEETNEDLAEKLERWRDRQMDYNVGFRIILLLLTSVIAITTFRIVNYIWRNDGFSPNMLLLFSVLAVWLLLVISSLLTRIIISRLDIQILAVTLPVMDVLILTLLRPILTVMDWFGSLVDRIEQPAEAPSAEDEIMSFVEDDDEANSDGALEETEKRMIKGIFDLDDTQVREIMTPRVDVVALPNTASIAEAKKVFISSGHSRIPVYAGTIDEIKGVLYAKDFLDETVNGKTLDEMAHQALYIPETKNVSALLNEFKTSSIHVAIIIDEYGGTSGVVTLEDILEKIVGEIRDEYDSVEEGEIEPETQPDGSVVFEGRSLISEVNDYLDLDIPDDENVDTIGGLVCREFGRIPEGGEALELGDIAHITVLKADQRKVLSVKIRPLNKS